MKLYSTSSSRFRVFRCGLAHRRTDVTNFSLFLKSFYETPSAICLFPNPRTYIRTFPLSHSIVPEIWSVTNGRTNTAKFVSVYEFVLHKLTTRKLSCHLQIVNTEHRNISVTAFPIRGNITSKQRRTTNFLLRQLISLMYLEQRDILNVNYLFKCCLYSLKKDT